MKASKWPKPTTYRVFHPKGIAPTITTMIGGGSQLPHIIEFYEEDTLLRGEQE